MKPTEITTEFAIKSYVEPARSHGEATVRIRVGTIQKELGWTNRTPSIYSTLCSHPFQREAGLELLEKRGGPASGGPSTTVEFIYRVLDSRGSPSASETIIPNGEGMLELYGILADAYRQLGGGEQYLKGEREGLKFPAEEYPDEAERERA